MKKFLVVGNGFDLAHGLPTRYNDFLYFLVLCIDAFSDWRNWSIYGKQDDYKLEQAAFNDILHSFSNNKAVKDIFDENFENIRQNLQSAEMKDLFKNDLMKYMICIYASKMNLDYEFHWIDVEDELMKFIIDFNNSDRIYVGNTICLNIAYQDESERNFRTFYCKSISRYLKTLSNVPTEKLKSKIFEYIFKQLEQFSSLLKFYLELIMKKFNNEKRSSHLHFRFNSDVSDDFYFSHIISFNYTNTAETYNPNARMYYVNGAVFGSLQEKNIILGFENPFSSNSQEYCNDNVHLFFKNVQRILYGFEYKHNRWFASMREDFSPTPKDIEKKIKDNARYVYIVGHSLSLSDKYILLDIIEKSDKIRIYYFNEEDKKSKITNLYKILGDEKFYEYVNNDSAKHRIVLCPQSEIEVKL